MKQTIKLFNKRFNSVLPWVALIIIGAIIGGVFEHLSLPFSTADGYTNLIAFEEGVIGFHDVVYRIYLDSLSLDSATLTLLIACIALTAVAVYRSEYKYSYNIGCSKGNNIVSNMLLGLAIGIIIFFLVFVIFFIAEIAYSAKFEYVFTTGQIMKFLGVVSALAFMFAMLFTAMYSISLFLIRLFQYNKIYFTLALIFFILAFCCIMVFPINFLPEKNAYANFIGTWKGFAIVGLIGAMLGYSGYILTCYKLEEGR